MGLRPQHRRLPPRRSGAGGGVGVHLLARRPHLPGALGRLHHAGEPGAGESLLGWRRAPARRQSVVHGFLGRLGFRRTLRWLDRAKRRVALDFLRGRGGVRHRHADGARTPESRAEAKRGYRFDTIGILTFMIAMLALQIFATQGAKLGWMSVASLGLLAVAVVFGVVFFRTESHNINAFIDFRLFRNMTYTGATLSNLLLNAVAGILLVAMTLVQIGGGMSAQGAGLLTLGYAIAIVAFIRVGEKLLQRLGPCTPMVWGSLIVGASVLLLTPTYTLLDTYKILAIVAFTLFGIGLAFYATPSTDAALANLPDDQAGAGSGIYKMASSLGASFGVAISGAIFTALSADNAPVDWIAGAITFVGRQDNLAIREAALFAFVGSRRA